MANFVSSGFDVIIKPTSAPIITHRNMPPHQPHRGGHAGDDVPGGGCQACARDGLPLRRYSHFSLCVSGIGDAVEAAGGEMHVMIPSKYKFVDIPQAGISLQ